MNNIKSCKFLKINDYHKSLPILPVPVRYKGGRGGGETVDKLREVWAVESGLGGGGGVTVTGGACSNRIYSVAVTLQKLPKLINTINRFITSTLKSLAIRAI